MKIDLMLSKLEKAKQTGRDTWLACCPAHEDKHPSLTIRETPDGLVLIHCFTGCSVEEILNALGLEFDALFPDKPIEHAKPIRRPFPAADVLEALAFESMLVYIAAADLQKGKPLSQVDHDRLVAAVQHIRAGRDLALG